MKLVAIIGMTWHKLRTKHKVCDVVNEERVTMECECGRYWSWKRHG